MALYNRNGIWWISIRRNNYEYVGSTQCRDKREAEKVLAEKLLEAASSTHKVLKQSLKVPFHKIAWEYYHDHSKLHKKTKENDEYYIRLFSDFFGDKNLSQITREDILDYTKDRLKQKYGEDGKALKLLSPSTVNRELNTLRAIFTYAKEIGRFGGESPLKGVKKFHETQGRLRFLTRDEFDALITVADDKLRSVILIAVTTGFRKGEIQNINIPKDVDFANNTIYLGKTKNGDSIYVHLNPVAKKVLQQQTEEMPFRYNFRKAFMTAARNSKLKNVVFHTLRHTYASWMVQAGENLRAVQLAMRHKSLKMTERYSHLLPTDQLKTADKVATILTTNGKRLELEATKK